MAFCLEKAPLSHTKSDRRKGVKAYLLKIAANRVSISELRLTYGETADYNAIDNGFRENKSSDEKFNPKNSAHKQ